MNRPSVRDSSILYTFENNIATGDEHPRPEVNFEFACRPCRERQRVDPAHRCRSTMILRPGDELRQECNLPLAISGPLAMLTQDSRVIMASTRAAGTEERNFPGASISVTGMSTSAIREMFDCGVMDTFEHGGMRDHLHNMREIAARRFDSIILTIMIDMLAAAKRSQPPRPEWIASLEASIALHTTPSRPGLHQGSAYSGLNTTFVSEDHFMTRPNHFPAETDSQDIHTDDNTDDNTEDGVQALMSNYLTVDMDAIRDSSNRGDDNPASELEEVD